MTCSPDAVALRLGVDGNLRWTAFGLVNARQHRVYIAVILGDAGTAVKVARSIDVRAIPVTERKANRLIDTGRVSCNGGATRRLTSSCALPEKWPGRTQGNAEPSSRDA